SHSPRLLHGQDARATQHCYCLPHHIPAHSPSPAQLILRYPIDPEPCDRHKIKRMPPMTSSTASPTLVRPSVHTTPVTNPHVRKWIEECVALCKPDNIYYCNGSLEERQALFEQGV